jgi:hypothetical protein
MGNISLILLWITLFIILGLFIFFGVKNIESIKDSKDAYILGVSSDNNCYPGGTINSLPQASGQCCVSNPSLQQFTIPNGDLQVLIGQQTLTPIQACKNYCNNFNSRYNTCNETNNETFNKCIGLLKPVNNCNSYSMPVAQYQGAPFYVNAGTWDSCAETKPC